MLEEDRLVTFCYQKRGSIGSIGSNMRGLSSDDWDKGCHDEQCIPECPFYPEYGRIEDAEVIDEHNKLVEKLRHENRIVDPPSESEMLRLLNDLKHLF